MNLVIIKNNIYEKNVRRNNKRIIILLFLMMVVLDACSESKEKKYLIFSGKIENKKCDSIILQKLYERNEKTVIKLSKDGSFKDTLIVKDGFHYVFIGREAKKVYFQNGDEINMTVDFNSFDKTLSFTGKGSDETSLMLKSSKERIRLNEKGLLDLPYVDFRATNQNYISEFTELLKDSVLDSVFVTSHKKTIKMHIENSNKSFKENKQIQKELGRGKSSPKFVDFIDYKGGVISLEDLKGKYVYLDFWATYCKPCINEFPSLENLIEKYKSKNIEFVYISLDFTDDFKIWKRFVADNELTGRQLFMGKDKSFKDAYKITGIPRYVLIDLEGNIVDAKTYSPSNLKLIELLDSLDI